jgi:hypothetical protein
MAGCEGAADLKTDPAENSIKRVANKYIKDVKDKNYASPSK